MWLLVLDHEENTHNRRYQAALADVPVRCRSRFTASGRARGATETGFPLSMVFYTPLSVKKLLRLHHHRRNGARDIFRRGVWGRIDSGGQDRGGSTGLALGCAQMPVVGFRKRQVVPWMGRSPPTKALVFVGGTDRWPGRMPAQGRERFWPQEGAGATPALHGQWLAQDQRWQRYWLARPAYKAAWCVPHALPLSSCTQVSF